MLPGGCAGSDGKVYNNKCLAECEGVSATDVRPDANRNCPSNSGRRLQTADDALSQPARVCPCPRIYKPVCGELGGCRGCGRTFVLGVHGLCEGLVKLDLAWYIPHSSTECSIWPCLCDCSLSHC